MDHEELTRRLLEEPPENWPEGMKIMRLPLKRVPEGARGRITDAIHQAVQEEATTSPPKPISIVAKPANRFRVQLIAAAVAAAVIVPGFFWLMRPSPTFTLDVVRAERTERRPEDSGAKASMLKTGDKITPGDLLLVAAGGEAAFKDGDTLHHIQGPATVVFRRTPNSDRPDFDFFIKYGTIAVRSPARSARPGHARGKHIAWSAPGIRCVMIGTVARFSADEKFQTLEVLEGAFEVRAADSTAARQVSAGMALYLEAQPSKAPLPEPKKLSSIELEDLDILNKKLQSLHSGNTAPASAPVLNSAEAIRSHYGSLQIVVLIDNRSYTGHITKREPRLTIHTTYGLIELELNMIKEIKEIK